MESKIMLESWLAHALWLRPPLHTALHVSRTSDPTLALGSALGRVTSAPGSALGRVNYACGAGYFRGVPKWFLAKWFFGGLGYQVQKIRHLQEKSGLLVLPPKATRPKNHTSSGGTWPTKHPASKYRTYPVQMSPSAVRRRTYPVQISASALPWRRGRGERSTPLPSPRGEGCKW